MLLLPLFLKISIVMSIRTVPLLKKNLFISRSCPILVLKAVLGRPRHADAKNSGKNYQGPTTS
jgi:hypothetical protein